MNDIADLSQFEMSDAAEVPAAPTIAVGCGIYGAIAAVMADVSKEGIAKDRQNTQQNYKFRGIDEVYNALSPILSRHRLCILPRMVAREVTEKPTRNGGVLFYVTVEAEFDFIFADDGSRHIVRTFGEAMDSADKATNKAMSAAYKYAVMQTFCIPTEGDNDADSTTHDVAGEGQRDNGQQQNRQQGNNRGDNRQQGNAQNGGGQQNGGGMPQEEWDRLIALMRRANVGDSVLLKRYDIRNLRDLSKDDYFDAIDRLNHDIAAAARNDSNSRGRQQSGGNGQRQQNNRHQGGNQQRRTGSGDFDPNDLPSF